MELAEQAICHRNLALGAGGDAGEEGVFISTRLLRDRFSLAFELFINVGHAFVDEAGVPESFSELAWNQAVADVRGETSLDAWESRAQAVGGGQNAGREPMRRPGRSNRGGVLRRGCDLYAVAGGGLRLLGAARAGVPAAGPQALAERLRLVARPYPAKRSTSLRSGIGGGREGEAGWAVDEILTSGAKAPLNGSCFLHG